MTRREILQSLMALPVLRAGAQAAPPIHYREYARCLPDYLSALAADAYTRRSDRIAKLKTPAAIREYQAWARRTFLQLAGPLPERTPLNFRTTGSFERNGYRVEKVVYESRPSLFVTANLYIPGIGRPPYPGVLFHMGHTANGKSYAPYQRCCQGLAQLGFLVLAFDPMGQGERTNYPRAGGWLTRLSSSDDEHTRPGRQMLLLGDTATAMQLWDAIRSLDVLASHPQVDPQRLASTGQSGGGTVTMMLMAADDRLSAAAVCSGNTENVATQPFFPPGSTDDAEQDFIGSGPLAFDRWDLLWPLAPKPLLITTSAHDFFGTYSPSYEASGREEYARLSRAYSTLGAASHLQSYESLLPHDLPYAMRLSVYNWFDRHLKGGTREITEEPPTAPENDEILWCGGTGNTIRDFGGKTPFMILNGHARTIETPNAKHGATLDLRALLGMPPTGPAPRLDIVATTSFANCKVRAVEVNSAPKVWVPAWIFEPNKSWSRLLLTLEPDGRSVHFREDDLYPKLAEAGTAVCAADIRGIGDMQPVFSQGGSIGYARGHESEENYAWSSLILGHSLLGQRTADVIALTQALAQAYPQAIIIVAARDKMTVPALCAAALEKRISRLYLAEHLVSWRRLVESEQYSYPLANFIPGILRSTDLPQIARSLAPGTVTVAGAVDAIGRVLPRDQSPYADYREASLWDVETLSGL